MTIQTADAGAPVADVHALGTALRTPSLDAPDDDLVRRTIQLRSADLDKRECTFTASTDTIDSYDEIVEQDWDLKRYKANPVILFAHNSRELPIGQATMCSVVKGELVTTIKFATAAANPLAEQVLQSVKEGTLRAVSVGFYPRSVRYEKRDDREVYVLSQCELHEISVVPVPANPDCVARMRARAAGSPGAVIETTDSLGNAVRRPAHNPTPAARVATPTAPAAADQPKEKHMPTIDELQADIAKRDATISTLTAGATVAAANEKAAADKISGLETRLEAQVAQTKTLAAERDAAVAAQKLAEDKLIDNEIGALIGVKITPAEKDTFTKLAKVDRSLFDEMIAQRTAAPTLAKVVPTEKDATNSATPGAIETPKLDLVALAKKAPALPAAT